MVFRCTGLRIKGTKIHSLAPLGQVREATCAFLFSLDRLMDAGGAADMPLVTTSWIFPQKGTMYASRKKWIIELDGSHHLDQKEYDEERTTYLETRGYRVLLHT